MTDEQKQTIDNMSQEEMARLWRFHPVGDPLFQGNTGQYFKKVFFEERGGFTPAISKALSWGD